MDIEKVIFRKEKNEYTGNESFLAVFPDDEAKSGHVAATPFHFCHGMVFFEAYCEISLDYYYTTKVIHKTSDEAQRLLNAVCGFYHSKFRLAEKIVR